MKTADPGIFRQQLKEQLYAFPENNRYALLFRLSEINDLLLFAHCIFIYRDTDTGTIKLLKRCWDNRQKDFVFAPGVFDTARLSFTDTHKIPENGAYFEATAREKINAPEKHNHILLDGVQYSLYTANGPLVSEKFWQLPSQLTGTLKLLTENIYLEAGPFQP